MRQTRIIAANVWIGVHVAESGADFNHFHAAAQLVGTGHLYDWNRVQQVELPYQAARAIWLLISGLALLAIGHSSYCAGLSAYCCSAPIATSWHPAADKMPNLHGLTYRLAHGSLIEIFVSLLVLTALSVRL